ncbi:MAG: amino-acid N-acetyltransferase subunit Mak10 [Lasallia pustulata]|uniref:Amino-acid N-acetyltransferase subunit Mak10 n=1 Tax=Lasallia pustulata TaxID=136370 RepID=A0A5M8PKR5_9LECA|nr:MAG: amino-acid N-acetyltransferase subunit Mak10 [Lasallia pustulata]
MAGAPESGNSGDQTLPLRPIPDGLSSSAPKSAKRPPNARDITAEFTQAASALNTGQLVKDDFFTLFEAVGALEIMDPKMDSGYLAPGEMLEDDYDVLRELLPEEVIGIMDQMLCYEMAWHMGHPLSQTLFTSLHIDRLLWPAPVKLKEARFYRRPPEVGTNRFLHTVLRAYCLATIKTCDFVNRRISAEHYNEEEDFVSNLYNRKLLTQFSRTEIEEILTKAIAWVTGQKKIVAKDVKTALLSRLNFRKWFMAAVAFGDDVDDLDSPSMWQQCAKLLPLLLESRAVGTEVADAFSAKIQRRLASTVPPRPIVNITFEEAHSHLSRLCEDGKGAYEILDYHGGNNMLTFLWTFQSRNPQPSIYIRCLLQSLMSNETKVLNVMSVRQLVFDDLAEMVAPAHILIDPSNDYVEAPKAPGFQIMKRMEIFVSRAAQSYLDIFRAICMNRERTRRMLCHMIVDWDNIQLDAEELDTELRRYTDEEPIHDPNSGEDLWSFPLSSWAYYHKLHQMEWIVQLGFELDIYQIEELAGMYWYLNHIAQTRLQHLQRIRTFTTRRFSRLTNPTSETKAAFKRSLSFLDFAMLETSATQSFADALACLFAALPPLSLLPPTPAYPYSTPSLRYSLRMRPFLPISLPALPTFAEYSCLIPSASVETPSDLLDEAELALKRARKEWEAVSKVGPETGRCVGCEEGWRKGVKDVLRGCIAGSIAVGAVRRAAGRGRER